MKMHARKVFILSTDSNVILNSEDAMVQYLIDNKIKSSETYFKEETIRVADTNYADYDNWKSKK